MRVRVECYSGYKADERPLRFYLGDEWREVVGVLGQWRTPEGICFRVRADDGEIYTLCQTPHRLDETWTLEPGNRSRSG